MRSHKTIIWFLVRFVITATLVSVLLIYIVDFFSSTNGVTHAVLTIICGAVVFYKLNGVDEFLISHISERKNDKILLIQVIATLAVLALFVNMVEPREYFTFVLFVYPILSLVCTVVIVLYHYSEHVKPSDRTSPSNSSKSHQNYSDGNEQYSVIFTGDHDSTEKYTSHGSAAWISDINKNRLTDTVNGKPSFRGLWIGGGFFHHKEGNLVSVAPPGTGKGAALIIPNLLWERDYKHSFVVFDPKGTNACITARFQQQQGNKVIIIDPMNLQSANRAKHGIPSASFNPLDHIIDDIFNGTAQIANLLIPDDPNGEKFWNQDGRNLVQAILMHIMTDASYIGRRDLIAFYKIMLTADFTELLQGMLLNDSLDGSISDFASGFIDMLARSEQTFTSVRSVANGSIKWLSNPALQACMKTSSFDPNDLEKGGVALYLCQPIQNKEGFATFSRLVIGFCLRANSKPAAKPKAWVYYLLDEFPTMGVFPEVIESLAYSREYRMRLWIFAQSLSQLDQIYKQEGRHQILGNARVLQAFGVTDHVTQEYISSRIGKKTVKVYTKSTSRGSSHSSGRGSEGSFSSSSGSSESTSNNESFHGQPLIEPNDVQYDPTIITISEWGPMRLSRWQYWQQWPYNQIAEKYRLIFKARAGKNPNIEVDDDFENDQNSRDESLLAADPKEVKKN